MRTSKERVIVLTSYERKSLFRFLAVYLVSVFILLGIIGYLFFENNRASMQEAMKFEMMYRARMLSSEIAMKAMEDKSQEILKKEQLLPFLRALNHCRFEVGYYDGKKKPLYTEIQSVKNFDEVFYSEGKNCFTVMEDKSEHLGVRYIVLKEYDLMLSFQELRIRIIGYLILSFLLMGAVGYFLGRLFLRPVREQIESLDNFISDTTHELNTPISAILMTIQSLKGVEPKKLKRLEASAKRLSVMYSSLTYRLEGKIEPAEHLNFATIIEERVEYVKELIESKRLNVTLSLEPTEVFMPKTSASRLIDNLLSNAIKYSDLGDSITISLQDHILKVKDTGIGIDKNVQDDIFKRYYRANEERGGFGIGLNIVLSVCKQYKIKLDLESKKGEGSTFILTFPKSTHR
ncbi:MAG TPA: HAMP domain-containing sensor histidine kinase [Sulfurovum sp.]|nr:HAMP domain-containing sensor histidine kinase [Sulfurovum sp.]HQS72566.1 HAMP domain-containing sensor histidine kinase [Sulfurovum sp.]HQS77166.1 HAMP domain-containing sensor histidine kinase [Sulfurovum sp.]HQT28546.1 HAMP domain-containing sensor histidine kinase [Sulfurovum sp.]